MSRVFGKISGKFLQKNQKPATMELSKKIYEKKTYNHPDDFCLHLAGRCFCFL